jgi:hypothetical protein
MRVRRGFLNGSSARSHQIAGRIGARLQQAAHRLRQHRRLHGFNLTANALFSNSARAVGGQTAGCAAAPLDFFISSQHQFTGPPWCALHQLAAR